MRHRGASWSSFSHSRRCGCGGQGRFAWIDDGAALTRNLGLLTFPFLAAYFAWKRRIAGAVAAALIVPFAGLAVALNLYPFTSFGAAGTLAALHAPVILWLLTGLAYVGGRWRSGRRRMDFVRFTGELGVYYTLLALGGAVLIALTLVAPSGSVPPDFQLVLGTTGILPIAMPCALLVAAWLVEAKQQVVENMAHILTCVFTPLTLAMLLVLLAPFSTAGGFAGIARQSNPAHGRHPSQTRPSACCCIRCPPATTSPVLDSSTFCSWPSSWRPLHLDAAMLTAMLTRIANFGYSPEQDRFTKPKPAIACAPAPRRLACLIVPARPAPVCGA